MSKPHENRPGVRLAAEWVTFGISLALIAFVAGYLIYEGLRRNSDFVPVETRIDHARVREVRGKFIIPVQVRNAGRRTLREVQLQILIPDQEPRQVKIEYLAELSDTTVFCVSDSRPAEGAMEARILHYLLD